MKVVRSVSMEVGLLQRIAGAAEEEGNSVSKWIEAACRARLQGGEKAVTREDPQEALPESRRAVTDLEKAKEERRT